MDCQAPPPRRRPLASEQGWSRKGGGELGREGRGEGEQGGKGGQREGMVLGKKEGGGEKGNMHNVRNSVVACVYIELQKIQGLR